MYNHWSPHRLVIISDLEADFLPILTIFCPVAHAHLADVVGGRVELGAEEHQRPAHLWNVVREDVLEEVPRLLPGHVVHGNQVGGIDAIPEELETHPGGGIECRGTWLLGQGEPGNSLTCSLEDACVRMTSQIDPLHLANGADGVDVLLPHVPSPAERQLVPLRVEGGAHVLEHDLAHLEHPQPAC